MVNVHAARELEQRIAELAKRRDALLNSTSLEDDLALETNVQSVAALYGTKSWRELQNVCAMILQQTQSRWHVQRSNVEALRHHAKLPPGIRIPAIWNADGMFFRAGAPVVISSASGVGKSTTARNIIAHNIINKVPTVYVTNEDTKAEAIIGIYCIYTRIVTGHSYSFGEVEAWNYKAGKGDKTAQERAKNLYSFANLIEKHVKIIEAEYWSMSQILYGIDDAENQLGKPPLCCILDYVQRIEPEPGSKRSEIRLQMIEASRMWANYVKSKQKVGILISQLNDDGKTAESQQFQKDAGQWLVIQRDYDDDKDLFSDQVKIRFRKGRRTGTGRVICHIDAGSGAFVREANYKPTQGELGLETIA